MLHACTKCFTCLILSRNVVDENFLIYSTQCAHNNFISTYFDEGPEMDEGDDGRAFSRGCCKCPAVNTTVQLKKYTMLSY